MEESMVEAGLVHGKRNRKEAARVTALPHLGVGLWTG
jgi:hypothetical protein